MIGGGQAGLAMGYYLATQGQCFVILDGAPSVGHSWRNHYNSLRLFTPVEYNNLPGLPFPKEPGVYPSKDEVADYLELYAPVVSGKGHKLGNSSMWPSLSIHDALFLAVIMFAATVIGSAVPLVPVIAWSPPLPGTTFALGSHRTA